MYQLERRPLLLALLGAIPIAAKGQTAATPVVSKGAFVPAGADRYGQHRTIGSHVTDFKVSSGDAGGGLFVMQHPDTKKGGPPRHMQRCEDEWFYVIEGDYLIEVGSDRFQLKPGDSILAPREIPHVYAFVGETPGKLLIAFAPGKNMEEYFTKRPATSGFSNEAEIYQLYGMELIGPGLSVG